MASTSACPSGIQITFYPYQIPISYTEVRALVPRLYEAYNGRVDIVLHMGTTMHRNFYSIEKMAHRDNYDAFPDVHGAKMDKRDGLVFWSDCPPILETSLDFTDVYARWSASILLGQDTNPGAEAGDMQGIVFGHSQDAGHFLCDFIYYSTLAEHWRAKKHCMSGGGAEVLERPVMFLHLPPWTGADDLRKGRAVTIALLKALGESWSSCLKN